MDYKQKYQKYKQKYLNLLKSQKGGEPFLMDILAGPVFSYLFERNQRLLQLIYTNRQPVMMQPLENFTLNHRYRLQLLGRSSISVLLATRLVQGEIRNTGLELRLAKRIISRTHELPEISPPTLATTLDKSNNGHSSSVSSVAFHPTLPLLATCSWDQTVKLWRLDKPDGSAATCVATLDSSKGWHQGGMVLSVAFHPTLPLLATGSSDNTMKLWRFSADGSAATLAARLGISNEGHFDDVNSVVFHLTLPLMATGSSDKTVKLWRLDKPDGSAATCVATLDSGNEGHSNYVLSVAFHPTLPLLATGSEDNTVKLWRLDKPDGSAATCVTTLDSSNGGHSSSVWSVLFHPTLPLLATCSSDNTTKLWRLDKPDGSAATCVATLDRSNEGHSSAVMSVAFHPTLPFLATGSLDRTTKLWHLVHTPDGSTATCVATLAGHSNSVWSVAFHPTAPLLATGSEDNTVKLWRL